MSLLHQQMLLAKMLTEQNPLDEIDFPNEQDTFYKSLKKVEILRFKESLLRKKFRGVCSCLPLSSKLLKGQLFDLFTKYSINTNTDGVDRYVKDSYQFAACLLPKLSGFSSAVVKLELALLEHHQQSRKKRLFYLNWPLKAIIDLDEKQKQRTLYLKTANSLIEINSSGVRKH